MSANGSLHVAAARSSLDVRREASGGRRSLRPAAARRHVIDPRNNISAVRDVAIVGRQDRRGRGEDRSRRCVEDGRRRPGCTSRPGLVDIHTHVYAGTGEKRSYAGDNSVYPDGFTLRVGVTTVADAGCSGWRNFEDFKERVIDRSQTRVLAFLNIVGHGMRGGTFEQDLAGHGRRARRPRWRAAIADLIVGIKTAHYAGPSGRRSSARSRPERSRTCR